MSENRLKFKIETALTWLSDIEKIAKTELAALELQGGEGLTEWRKWKKVETYCVTAKSDLNR